MEENVRGKRMKQNKQKPADYTRGELEDVGLIFLPASAGISADEQKTEIIIRELWTRQSRLRLGVLFTRRQYNGIHEMFKPLIN